MVALYPIQPRHTTVSRIGIPPSQHMLSDPDADRVFNEPCLNA
jgi:hypothetical protein